MQAGGEYRAGYPDYLGNYPAAQDEANGGTSYVVQPGDTLSQIAARLGVPTDYLAGYNGITDPDLIYSGQPLYYPVGIGEYGATGDVAISNPSEMGGNGTVEEEGVVPTGEGTIVTGPPPRTRSYGAPTRS